MNEILDKLKEYPATRRTLIGQDYYNYTRRCKLNRKIKRLRDMMVIGSCNLRARKTLFFAFDKKYVLFKTKDNMVYYGLDTKITNENKIEFAKVYKLEDDMWIKPKKKTTFYCNEMVLVI